MVRSIAAQIALLSFAVALLAGIYAGNPPLTVLFRALIVMVAGMWIGQLIAWAIKAVLRDSLQRKKLDLDRQHVAEVDRMTAQAESDAEGETATEAG